MGDEEEQVEGKEVEVGEEEGEEGGKEDVMDGDTAGIDLPTRIIAVWELMIKAHQMKEVVGEEEECHYGKGEEQEDKMEGEVVGIEEEKMEGEVQGKEEEKMEGEVQGKEEMKMEGEVQGTEEEKMEGEVQEKEEMKMEGEVQGKEEEKMEGAVRWKEEMKMEGEVQGKKEGKMEREVQGKEEKMEEEGWVTWEGEMEGEKVAMGMAGRKRTLELLLKQGGPWVVLGFRIRKEDGNDPHRDTDQLDVHVLMKVDHYISSSLPPPQLMEQEVGLLPCLLISV